MEKKPTFQNKNNKTLNPEWQDMQHVLFAKFESKYIYDNEDKLMVRISIDIQAS